jgi:membrane protein DedA with SNARE-associated domain
MERLTAALKTLLVFGLALRIHHKVQGPAIDYVGLAAAASASWIGLPGPGEPVLIAAGVFAARHKLDIVSVVVVAWLAAVAGGVAGWLIGLKGGRAILTRRGPLYKMRMNALARGEELFGRYPVIAIVLTPSFIAGIHRVGTVVFLATTLASAALWAAGIGLSAYLIGPTVIDEVSDLGLVTSVGLGVLIVGAVAAEILRRRRRRRATPAAARDG